MSTTDALIEANKARRTIYKLGKNSPVPDSKIEELVNEAILHVPSSFNTQSTRLVVLLHAEHERLWDIVIETFMQLVQSGAVPEAVWKNQTLPKLQGMKNGVGTVRLPVRNPLNGRIKLTHRRIDPLLRRPSTHQALLREIRNLQGSVPALGGALERHASVLPYASLPFPLFSLRFRTLT